MTSCFKNSRYLKSANKLLLFGLLTSLNVACSPSIAKRNPPSFEQGILWAIVNPENNDTSYLMGTIHTMDTNLIKLPLIQLEELAKQTEMLCLETKLPDSNGVDRKKLIARAMDASILQDTRRNITNQLDQKSLKKLVGILRSSEQPLSLMEVMLDKIQPSVLTFMMVGEKQKRSPFFKAHNFSPEGHFTEFAKNNHMEIAGLEKAGASLDLIFGGSEHSFSENMEVLRETIANFDSDSNDIFRNYLMQKNDYWRKDGMVDPRNRPMAAAIDSLIQNNTLFVMIGAAHLAGEDGVLTHLHEKGYMIRNVEISLGALDESIR